MEVGDDHCRGVALRRRLATTGAFIMPPEEVLCWKGFLI